MGRRWHDWAFMRSILDFLANWGEVLRDSLPAAVQNLLGLGRRFAVIEAADDAWRLFQARGGSLTPHGTIDIARLADEMRRLDGPVVLVLPQDHVMRPAITLPETAARSLDQVLDVEIERLTPFKASDVAVAREVQATSDGQIRVNLTIVPLTRVEAVTRPLVEAGIEIAHVIADPARVAQATAASLSGTTVGSSARSIAWVPALAMGCLLVAALISPFLAQEQRLREQHTEIERLAPGFAAARRLTLEIGDTQARQESARDFLRSRVSATALLENITRALPDHTWLVLLQIAEGRITLEGRSSSAPALVTLLNAAPGLNDARFDAPVTRDPATGADRFRLGAAIEGAARVE